MHTSFETLVIAFRLVCIMIKHIEAYQMRAGLSPLPTLTMPCRTCIHEVLQGAAKCPLCGRGFTRRDVLG